MLLAILKFLLWETAVGMAAFPLARIVGWRGIQLALGTLAIQITLESSFAAVFSFSGLNSIAAYWILAAVCGGTGIRASLAWWRENDTGKHTDAIGRRTAALMAGLTAPLLWLSFRPVEEIDSINYLHYLIEWMANRSTPYTFATNYVAFWELSFLPTWVVTRADWFFPLLALKAVVLLALALWLVGRELGVPSVLLEWTIFGALMMRHYWFEYSGVPTLKNDVLHGVGFVLLLLVVMRSRAGRALSRSDVALFALGASFASVKYTGMFLAALAIPFVLRIGLRQWSLVASLFLLTSGHYYLRSFVQHGNPFYPFQINLGFIHLPGTADLSYTAILYHLHDPRLWRALFWPGISPAGLLFPAILAGSLAAAVWICFRAARARRATPIDWTAAALLCGWLLYFRSVYGASAGRTDLTFILNNLNSIRYVDGILAASELFLAALLGRFAWPLMAINAASRWLMLCTQIPLQVLALAIVLSIATLLPKRLSVLPLLLAIASPLLVEYHRSEWTTYWDDLKPALQEARSSGLAGLALEDGGYFAGHVVAAGNPVNPSVQAFLADQMETLAEAQRPRYLAVLVTPGSGAATTWRERYAATLSRWGYHTHMETKFGGLYERNFR